MKWKEMTKVRKLVCVFGYICCISYLVLLFLDLADLLEISRGAAYPLFGIYLLCMGINTKNKKLAIMNYVTAALFFLLSLIYFIFL